MYTVNLILYCDFEIKHILIILFKRNRNVMKTIEIITIHRTIKKGNINIFTMKYRHQILEIQK